MDRLQPTAAPSAPELKAKLPADFNISGTLSLNACPTTEVCMQEVNLYIFQVWLAHNGGQLGMQLIHWGGGYGVGAMALDSVPNGTVLALVPSNLTITGDLTAIGIELPATLSVPAYVRLTIVLLHALQNKTHAAKPWLNLIYRSSRHMPLTWDEPEAKLLYTISPITAATRTKLLDSIKTTFERLKAGGCG